MAIYGYIKNGLVLAIQNQESYDATDLSVQHLWSEIPDGTIAGSICGSDGSFTPPVPPPAVPMPGVAFYNALTLREQADIEASTDPLASAFWARLLLLISTKTPIDPGGSFMTDGLAHLSTTDVDGASPSRKYIAPERVAPILAGAPQ